MKSFDQQKGNAKMENDWNLIDCIKDYSLKLNKDANNVEDLKYILDKMIPDLLDYVNKKNQQKEIWFEGLLRKV
jgi:hypothetical protein